MSDDTHKRRVQFRTRRFDLIDFDWRHRLRLRYRPVIDGGLVGERGIGNVSYDLAALLHTQVAILGYVPNHNRVKLPLLEDVEDFAFAALCGDDQHSLLRLGEHDFVRRHPCFALRHKLDVYLDAVPRARAHFA